MARFRPIPRQRARSGGKPDLFVPSSNTNRESLLPNKSTHSYQPLLLTIFISFEESHIISLSPQSPHWLDQLFTLEKLRHALFSKKDSFPCSEKSRTTCSNICLYLHLSSSAELSTPYGLNLSFPKSGDTTISLPYLNKIQQISAP